MATMHRFRLWIVAAAVTASSAMLLSSPAGAQTPRVAARAAPVQQAQPVDESSKKCLRALNGACTNPVVVELARQRAMIMPAVRVSYFGTPAGTVGGRYIPFERIFQDNPQVFGLPTVTLVNPACCVTRTK
jgi:hypothetical protein